MIRLLRYACLAQFVFLLAILSLHGDVRAQVAADPPSSTVNADQPGVLVLQDGGVLVGKIAHDGDHYVLSRAGGEFRVPAAGVLLVAKSLDDAYAQRRQLLVSPTVDGHLTLAEWCLRLNMVVHARNELEDARKLDAENPRLELLERRLALAAAEPRTAQATKAQAPTADPSGPIRSSISDLPDATVERFTRKVQPVLVNSCTLSGCHQPGGAEEFQLDRAILRGLANRRSTMSNLAATLELVDRERPQLRPLLTVPRRTHGGMERPVFGPRQEQAFRHLVDWVTLVTQKTSSPQQNTDEADEDGAPSTPDNQLARLTSPILRLPLRTVEVVPASAPGTNESQQDAETAAYEATVAELAAPPQLRIGAQLQKWQPRDPFDPEIFNRRQSPRAVEGNSAKTKEPANGR